MHAAEVTRGLSEGGGRPRRGEAREKETLGPLSKIREEEEEKEEEEEEEEEDSLASEEAESLMIFLITPARGERKEGGVDGGS